MSSAAFPVSDPPHEGKRRRGSGTVGGGTTAGVGIGGQGSSSAAAKEDLDKPNESWFLILVNAFKSNYEQTLTYKEAELYEWIMKAYPYYRHDMHTMQTSVKTTLHSYECFRQSGRGSWTFIPQRALIHLESLKAEGDRSFRDGMYDQGDDDDDDEPLAEGEGGIEEYHYQQDHGPVALLAADGEEGGGSGASYPGQQGASPTPYDITKRLVPMRIPTDTREDLMAEDSPTLTAEEIERFKQEHQEAASRKLKRKASISEVGGRPWPRPRSQSPVKVTLEDEYHMSMEAWCNLLVQMFEASPKQKTIREIFSWVHDNYPVYREAPDESWKTDLTAALESNPLFRPMGRGRWQMASPDQQPPSGSGPVVPVIIGGPNADLTAVTIIPTIQHPTSTIEEDADATDSPSVTEDEDWKAIGSKRLLNFGFRRYSIATDTVPKKQQLKAGEGGVGSGSSSSARGGLDASQARQSGSGAHLTIPNQSTGGLSPYGFTPHDQASLPYSGGRRYSSFHQPTPKNSPPMLPQSSHGLSTVPEVSLLDAKVSGTLSSEETDEDEELMTKRYMAPLHNAINAAILANNYPSHPNFPSAASTPATLHSSQFEHQQQHHHQRHQHHHHHQGQQHQLHQYNRSSSVPRDLAVDGPQNRRHSIAQSPLHGSHIIIQASSSSSSSFLTEPSTAIFVPEARAAVATPLSLPRQGLLSAGTSSSFTSTTAADSQLPQPQSLAQVQPPDTAQGRSSAEQQQPTAAAAAVASGQPNPEIVIPNSESLAGDQMAAIQALALLAGSG